MSKLSPARSFALACLLESDRSGRFVREVAETLPHGPVDARDAAFALRLALGATATSGTLDELLDRFISRPGSVEPAVRLALRIASFEIVYLGAPAHVAVSQGVELVRRRAKSASGMANAVLRRVADARESYLSAEDVPDGSVRERTVMARSAGLPLWLTDEICGSLGEESARRMLDARLRPAPVAFHLNPRFSPATGFGATDAGLPCLPGLIRPVEAAAFIRSGALGRADAVASDAAAQLIATAATMPGSCLEIGAGRGTKTFTMCAQARRFGFRRAHTALDLSARKGELNLERLRAGGLDAGVHCVSGDGRDLDAILADADAAAGGRAHFDCVFIDAPCSGTGTMRRHPEIPWRLAPSDVEGNGALPRLQSELLRAASSRVAPGGELLYATCSVLSSENGAVVDAFLSSPEGADFRLAPVHEAVSFSLPSGAQGGARSAIPFAQSHEDRVGRFQTVPVLEGCDGHFCARMVRSSDSR